MMRAAVYDRYGPPEVLRLESVPVPEPGAGQVLVQVVTSSVNDWDYHLLTGKPFVNRAAGLRAPQYRVLGADLAGRVVATGPGVSRFSVGDEVMGDVSEAGFGAFAQYAVAPEAALTPKRPELGWVDAAALPQAGGLAAIGLRYRRRVRQGEHVLVNGAGGGVGTLAVQIAAAVGAQVTAVDAAHKLDALADLGASRTIDYREHSFTDVGSTYDRIVDVTCSRPMRAYRRCLADGGVAAIIGGSIPRVFLALAVGAVPQGRRHVGVPLWRPNEPGDTAFVRRLVAEGSVVPVIDSVVDLDDIRSAFERFDRSAHTGKIVVSVAD
jgi:NADPH:quinone reductase-like Zn-dependent oxidoreductase